jgi:hypothetical protein
MDVIPRAYPLHNLRLGPTIFRNISFHPTGWELEDQVVGVFGKRHAGDGQRHKERQSEGSRSLSQVEPPDCVH